MISCLLLWVSAMYFYTFPISGIFITFTSASRRACSCAVGYRVVLWGLTRDKSTLCFFEGVPKIPQRLKSNISFSAGVVGAVQSTTHSIVSNRKTSSMVGAGNPKHQKLPPGVQAANQSTGDNATGSQVCINTCIYAYPSVNLITLSLVIV